MCLELKKFIDRISEIFSAIESARPRCTSGIQALCSLHSAIYKAKLLIQHCSESSKLYLAITTGKMHLRCEKIRDTLQFCLSQIQAMVPSLLAAKISGIVHDLKAAKFPLESSEEEAGKIVIALIRQEISMSRSVNNLELQAVQDATLRLNITSPLGVLIEKRSIRRLLEKVNDTNPTKKNILKYLLYLLRKYGEKIVRDNNDITLVQHDESSYQSIEPDDCGTSEPPDEFKCPISMRLMYDPVIIASGKTFERFWIEKWFNEGNETCPITHMKLDNLSPTPNSVIKSLISEWSSKQGITIPDPSLESHLASLASMESSSSCSIASFGSSMNKLHFEISSVSLCSSGTNGGSEMLDDKSDDSFGFRLSQINLEPERFYRSDDCDGNILESLCKLSALSWESQCKTVGVVKNQLEDNKQACRTANSNSCIRPLIKFLKDGRELRDVKAQRDGAEVLLAILKENRSEMPTFDEDGIYVLASYLDSEITGEALAIMEILSCLPTYKSMMVATGVLPSILEILDTKSREFHSIAMKILCNLSCNRDIGYHFVYLDCLPRLVPLLEDQNLAWFCIRIIRNLCCTEEVRIAVGETSSCISAIANLLETGTKNEQEYAADVLLSVCRERAEFSQLIMRDNIIQAIVNISVNGTSRGKMIALELLQLLPHNRDHTPVCSVPKAGLGLNIPSNSGDHYRDKKSSFGAFRFLGKKISLYSTNSSS
ncbi:U-box domain-containing protein 5 [Morella rubra]|uniref:RING-type E3 ubiquitin transferase n=1 Tax=Morella rubra TaxID=262757 RepID=A0A6A1WCT4_9ROSI|nr:U-box domain-containing protein 5 [Morella rubra]